MIKERKEIINSIKNKKIYLLRHGETKWNREGRCQGILDSPLTDRGREQVRRNGILLRKYISNIKKEDIQMYSSPLGRTKESSEIILNELKWKVVDVIYDSNLQEGNLGSWAGKTKEEISKENNVDFTNLGWYFNSPNGESYKDIEKRCSKWLSSISNIAKDNIILMTHGLVSIVLRGLILDLDFKEAIQLKVPQKGFYFINNGIINFITEEYDEFDSYSF
ncbi:histidine phosphatase family protein [Miniphocaeibacter halophilus]|uniref:Histidine phosphatase family protein n=1 Tax=Miniphocaeibacter halophilus TaxID=2931922 RepID=A0AC61MQS9_9FIRM|nr:histidine phosphatase family protein [Miniphocaeibacter halophilus]QQK08045.1 histidine phosphatase family protein [Miniphocaeibacter halophilus]